MGNSSNFIGSDPWEHYPHKTVLVTGSRGFIGRAVVARLLAIGADVVPYDLPESDIRDPEAALEAVRRVDAVIHLAGVLGTHELFDCPGVAVDVNIHGSLNMMWACAQYDKQYTGITMPQVFPSIYTATKVATTSLADALHHSMNLRCSHVRAFNAFGPGQAHGPGHPQKIIPTFAVKAWSGEPLPVWGDGMQTVDLIYTDDLASILVYAARFGGNQVFDGGTGAGKTVLQAAFDVCQIVGIDPVIEFLPMRRGEIPTQIVAQREGWGVIPESILPRSRNYLAQLQDTVMSYKP